MDRGMSRTQKIQVQSGVASNSHVTMGSNLDPSWNQVFFLPPRPHSSHQGHQCYTQQPALNPLTDQFPGYHLPVALLLHWGPFPAPMPVPHFISLPHPLFRNLHGSLTSSRSWLKNHIPTMAFSATADSCHPCHLHTPFPSPFHFLHSTHHHLAQCVLCMSLMYTVGPRTACINSINSARQRVAHRMSEGMIPSPTWNRWSTHDFSDKYASVYLFLSRLVPLPAC